MNIKLLTETATLPTRGSKYSAGYDLYADITEDLLIDPNHCQLVGTGIAVEIPDGYFGAIFARSGIATKRGLRPANCVGVVDSDYRGEVKVAVFNDSPNPQKISPQERIAQLVIIPYKKVELNVVDELIDTTRGEGGFGSTGTK